MIEIIPAIDIIGGKCVRLSQGDYEQVKIYDENPIEVAKRFVEAGFRRLHLVDLEGAKAQHIVNYRVLEKIKSSTPLIVDFGGGLKTNEDIRIAFECGADMITVGSVAVKNPETFVQWISQYGAEKIILSADVRNNKIAVSGWTENTEIELIPFIHQYFQKGIQKVLCTDIGKDGMLEGTAIELYKKIMKEISSLYLIASGGVSSIHDIENLEEIKVPAVVVGKALYEGKIKLNEFYKYL
ncbi:MAG TPA: 1-(5-phosphoribosyl)-5-[(5-phosphoribosylamino)methylideneamino]imidazole-4-carboxamide isomerase [Paludibacteraceae bacterium]|nr:1-(5-phosphoribosyl)-5-[(5-phosphoribosylamino)methylideneamino]imidazole-4-carboxamide isomerase [Paludibacteraceae bacterium]